MLNHGSKKNGYTLVEVLVVVTIMGVLSSMGVAGLRGAVINARIKDCAQNTAAFLERVANDANRLSKRICVKKDHDQRITAYVTADCGNLQDAEELATFAIEAPAKFACGESLKSDIETDFDAPDMQSGALFVPRIGLSAAPIKGFICIQYGDGSPYGLAVKTADKNMIIPMWGHAGSDGVIHFSGL
jgi:prepilin-type N-terminal cleavage/methylation domain-containing protein